MKTHVDRKTKITTVTLTGPEEVTILKAINLIKQASFLETPPPQPPSDMLDIDVSAALAAWLEEHKKAEAEPSSDMPLFKKEDHEPKKRERKPSPAPEHTEA